MAAVEAPDAMEEDKAWDQAVSRMDEPVMSQSKADDSVDPMALLVYYRRILPFKSLYMWLNRDITPARNFTHREFALTLQNNAYLRYQSYSTWDEWKLSLIHI